MGRVSAAYRGIVWGAAPLGAIAAGALAAAASLRLPILVAGALQITVALALAWPLLASARDRPERGAHVRGRLGGEPDQ
jgi:membrane protein implicated in regulation of membrane protease activity